MKTLSLNALALASVSMFVLLSSCSNDDPVPLPGLTGNESVFNMASVNGSGVSGTVTFAEREDNSALVTIELNGTSGNDSHPAHIHLNTAAEGGGIAIDLEDVDPATGISETEVSATNDGTTITYADLANFDGHVNVHLSASNLSTLIAQGDIGQNALTGESKTYELFSVSDPSVSGEATFFKRANDETLIIVDLEGDASDSDHPSHIHANSAAEGGGIMISLSNVKAGMSITNINQLDNGTAVTYNELLEFDGYINVHNSSSDMGTLVAQGDIGQNELTGNSENYELFSVSDPGISGEATFSERVNGETLVVINLTGDASDSDHPTHIHANTAAEGGGIVISLSNVKAGMSKSNVVQLDNGTAVTYNELLEFDGYINVHNSSSDMGTLVAQGDIGQNELTGTSENYQLSSVSDPGISGEATFSERVNGETLVVINLTGDASDSDHPTHIHANTAAEGGGIVISLSNVKAGMSKSNVVQLDDGTAVTYNELLEFDGYINVHNSSSDMGTLVAQGDIGQNAFTGNSVTYSLTAVSDPAISGSVTFTERMNGESLVTIELTGTTSGGDHPSHIHVNNAATGGSIAISLSNVNGDTGLSRTNVTQLNTGTAITYDELLVFDGHVNVHKSPSELSILIAQGDIGSNG